MPTYKNLNTNNVIFANTMFESNVNTSVDFFVPYKELNFELISNEPLVKSPILFSGLVTNETIEIPRHSKINISIVTDSRATIYLADDIDGINITNLYGFEISTNWRRIGKITIEGTANVVIEAR